MTSDEPHPHDDRAKWLTALDLASVGLSMAALGVSRLSFNLVASRFLGLELVGSANVCLSMALLIALPTSAGLAAAVSRFIPLCRSREEAVRALSSALKLSVAIVVTGQILCMVVARIAPSLHVDTDELGVIFLWANLYAVYAIGRSHLYAERRVRLALGLELVGFVAFGIALVSACVRAELWWIPFAVYPLPVALRLLLVTVRSRSGGRPDNWSEFSRFAWMAFLGSASSLGIQYGSTLVVGALGGASQAGAWATMTSAVAPVLLLPRSLSTLYLPRLSKLSATSRVAFDALSAEHLRLATTFGLPVVAIAMLCGPFVMPLVLGAGDRPEIVATWCVLCLSTYVICRKEPLITAIAALGRAGINASAAFVGALTCAVIWIAAPVLVDRLLAISLGTLAQAAVSPTVAAWLARRRDPSAHARWTPRLSDGAMILLTVCGASAPRDPRVALLGCAAVLAVVLIEARRARVAPQLHGLS